jgi:hypothetical protein
VSHTTKSPLRVAREALTLGEQNLAPFGHKHSPKKYTQAQLFAILALKQFFRTDYRGIVEIIEDSSDLKRVLKLTRLPHYTTLSHAARRLEQKGGGNISWMAAWLEPGSADSWARAAARP